MTILFVFDVPIFPNNGGVERITHTLAEHFMRQGHSIMFLARIPRENKAKMKQAAEQYYFPSTDVYAVQNRKFYHDFIASHNIDLVINQNGAEESSYLFCDVPRGIRLITVNHTYPMLNYYTMRQSLRNLQYDYTPKNIIRYLIKGIIYPYRYFVGRYMVKRWLNRLYTYILHNSEKFVVLSPSYFKGIEFATNGKCDYSKLVAIPNVNTYSEVINKKQIETKKKQILYVGRFTIKEKRPDRMLYIWQKLYEKHPDWELLMIGGQGELYEKWMKNYVKRNAIERITFLNSVSPLKLYRKASLSCLVSNYEGFGLVVTEAMQNGTIPIVFNSFGTAADIITSGKNGFLVTPFDYDEFADRLSELMQNKELREKVAQNAIDCVVKFNFEKISPLWEQLIK